MDVDASMPDTVTSAAARVTTTSINLFAFPGCSPSIWNMVWITETPSLVQPPESLASAFCQSRAETLRCAFTCTVEEKSCFLLQGPETCKKEVMHLAKGQLNYLSRETGYGG